MTYNNDTVEKREDDGDALDDAAELEQKRRRAVRRAIRIAQGSSIYARRKPITLPKLGCLA